MKVSFNGVTKIIQVIEAPDGNGDIYIDVKVDLYSDWKEWKLESDNSKFLEAMRTVGGDPLPGSKSLGATFFLMNGWKIRPYEDDHTLNINGNLYCEDGSVPYVSTVGDYNVMVISSVSSLVDSTVQQLKEIEYASFGEGVTVDITSSYTGTDYPTGTQIQPVNNLVDALSIANYRGFKRFYIKESMDINTGADFSKFEFVGQSPTKTILIISSPADVTKCEFYEATVTGTLDGQNKLKSCKVQTLNFVNGIIENCLLDEYVITLGGGVDAHFLNCWSGVAGVGTPIIDMGGSGQNLGLRNYNGGLKIQNFTGPNNISLDLNSGRVVLDDNTVISGTVVCRGVGTLVDNYENYIATGIWNGGVTIVNTSIDATAVGKAVWDVSIESHQNEGSTGESLNQAATASGLPAEITEQDKLDIADRVWDESTAGHVDVGSYGEWASTVADNIVRTLGLTQENYYLDNTTYTEYSGAKLLTGGRLRIYSVAGSVGTANDVIATYQIVSTWSGDELNSYKVTKV